jgi:hypothetical protein
VTDELTIDLGALKVSEIEEIEELLGTPLDVAFAAGQPKGRAMRALGYIAKKRDDPDFTWEQAGDLVIKVNEVPPTGADESAS